MGDGLRRDSGNGSCLFSLALQSARGSIVALVSSDPWH